MNEIMKKVTILSLMFSLVFSSLGLISSSYADGTKHHLPVFYNAIPQIVEIDQESGIMYCMSTVEKLEFFGGNIKSFKLLDKSNQEVEPDEVADIDHVDFVLGIDGQMVEETYKIVLFDQMAFIDHNDYFTTRYISGYGYEGIQVGTTFGQLLSTTRFRQGVRPELRFDGKRVTDYSSYLVEDHLNDLYFVSPEYAKKITLQLDFPFVVNDNRFGHDRRNHRLILPYPMSLSEVNDVFLPWNKFVVSIDSKFLDYDTHIFPLTYDDYTNVSVHINFIDGNDVWAKVIVKEAPKLRTPKGVFGYDFEKKTVYVDTYSSTLSYGESEIKNTKLYDRDGNIIVEGNHKVFESGLLASTDKVVITMPGGYDIWFKPVFIQLTDAPKEEILVQIEFSDLENAWAKEEIGVLAGKGIISGSGDGTFNPNGNLTRAAFAKMLIKSLNLTTDKTETYVDIQENDWFKEIAVIAHAYGLTKDMENFKGNETLSRQEMAYMAAKALEFKTVETKSDFTDYDDIDQWAQSSVDFLVSKGFINGSEQVDGTFKFNPMNSLTRQESVKVIFNILGLE